MGVVELKLLLSFLQALQAAPQPGPQQPATIQAPASIAEVGELVLHCYHPSGRFTDVNVIQHPWPRGRQYNATDSAVLSIDWHGAVLQTRFRLIVALVGRGDAIKAVVLADNDAIPPNGRCPLNQWVGIETTAKGR